MKGRSFISNTNRASLVLLATGIFFSCNHKNEDTKAPSGQQVKEWFPSYSFDAATFKKAPREFGPYTRWWWPGNDVTDEELKREIKMLADNGFAGVEIQPLTIGINPAAPKEQTDKVYSWDSPSFYEHVKAVMDQAKVSGITVDMNGGSGWPLGGPFIKPEESMLTLAQADTTVAGGIQVNMPVPKTFPDKTKILFIAGMPLFNPVSPSLAKLQAVVAYKVLKQVKGQTYLDGASAKDITAIVRNERIIWTVPAGGNWKIIAFWSIPDGEKPALIATPGTSYVVNHFDTVQLVKIYEHLFAGNTGLASYYGNPFRAVFNDSYEFKPDRHFTEDFLAYFKKARGYDIKPWLAANIQTGYNNAYAGFIFPGQKPQFIFNDEDWRLRYDYDLTVGELLRKRFIEKSNQWLHNKGLLHRTQAYGVKMDIIAGSGSADIPEAEQLFAKGAEAYIKLITSGAHLYNKPVISQESFVFMGRAEMMTPQKIRLLTDKALTAGVNQIFYHGTPYKYKGKEYGDEGWNTWSTPFMGPINFSSDINESYPYWNDIKQVNQYIARSQYALRSGKPHADVLIYYPFVDFDDNVILANPGEILTEGYLAGVEPDIKRMGHDGPTEMTPYQKWLKETYNTLNALHAAGVTWEWVNDESLQNATIKGKEIDIRGNRYQALILPNTPFIQLNTAQHVDDLAQQGMKLLAVGKLPEKQPAFLDYQKNDAITKQLVIAAAAQNNSTVITDAVSLGNWINTLSLPLKFATVNTFTRSIDRVMQNGDRIKMIWNQSDKWQTISLIADASFVNIYNMDAVTGTISAVDRDRVSCTIPPYSSIIIYAGKTKFADNLLNAADTKMAEAKEVQQLSQWTISSGSETVNNSTLFDWKTNTRFKYLSTVGVYTTSFNLNKENDKSYFIDLGKVYFAAEVTVNGKPAGTRLWAPYELVITDLVQQGENKIEVRITPTLRNKYIYEAMQGNPHYTQFKEAAATLMPAGLVGPVTIRVGH